MTDKGYKFYPGGIKEKGKISLLERRIVMLSKILNNNREQIEKWLYLGYVKWGTLINRLEKEQNSQKPMSDEQLWTFIMASGYAIAGQKGLAKLAYFMTGKKQTIKDNSQIWFEVLPLPPRKNEGSTHLDLALGAIKKRNGTESGIEFDREAPSWICFCEMKWFSDIAYGVTNDIERNQLIRVIENAVTFQADGNRPENIFVTLITPNKLKESNIRSRLYHYKFEEYKSGVASRKGHDLMFEEIKQCQLEPQNKKQWKYPEEIKIRELLANLNLNWISYEVLFRNLPNSKISDGIKKFWNTWRLIGNRKLKEE